LDIRYSRVFDFGHDLRELKNLKTNLNGNMDFEESFINAQDFDNLVQVVRFACFISLHRSLDGSRCRHYNIKQDDGSIILQEQAQEMKEGTTTTPPPVANKRGRKPGKKSSDKVDIRAKLG